MLCCPSRFRGVRWFALAAVLCCAVSAAVFGRKGVDDFSSGMTALNRGELLETLESLQRLRPSHPGDDRTQLLSGAIRLRRGDAPAALKDFSSLQPEGEFRAPALQWTGECLYALGRLTEACFQQLLQIHRDSTVAHRWLAAIYHDLGELNRSVKHLERLTQLAPEDHRPWRMMASIHRDNGDLARQCLDRARTVGANDVAVLRLNADLATDEKRPRDAAELYELILVQEPHHVECRYQLALARRELGDVPRYESETEKVATSRGLLEQLTALSARAMSQPRDAELLTEIAHVCDQLGKHD